MAVANAMLHKQLGHFARALNEAGAWLLGLPKRTPQILVSCIVDSYDSYTRTIQWQPVAGPAVGVVRIIGRRFLFAFAGRLARRRGLCGVHVGTVIAFGLQHGLQLDLQQMAVVVHTKTECWEAVLDALTDLYILWIATNIRVTVGESLISECNGNIKSLLTLRHHHHCRKH